MEHVTQRKDRAYFYALPIIHCCAGLLRNQCARFFLIRPNWVRSSTPLWVLREEA